MRRYVLSTQASIDLDNIWDYTAARWSIDQAERYLSSIRATFDMVIDHPNLGGGSKQIRKGYRRRPVGSHIVYYRVLADRIVIVRVLHQSMDFSRLI